MQTISPETVGLSTERLRRIDSVVHRYIERRQVAGAIVVVSRYGQVAHIGCYGYLDLEKEIPMREDAIFRIFSMSKVVTCLAVMMLIEEGQFQLQTPVAQFIPAFADLQVLQDGSDANNGSLVKLNRPITIYDLLTHTSGLGYGLDTLTPVDRLYQQEKVLRMDESLAEKMPRICRLPLHHQPGVRFTYSIAIDVLGYIIERVSGQALDVFLKQRIFAPLKMSDTDFYVPAEKLDRLAAHYTLDTKGELINLASLNEKILPPYLTGLWVNKSEKPRFLSGGGGLVSTTADFLRFTSMLMNKGELEGVRLVSRKTVEWMTSPHLTTEQLPMPGASLGLGVMVITDPARAQIIASTGAYGGGGAAGTEFWIDPMEKISGLLMIQYTSTTPLMLGTDFKTLAVQALMY